MTELAMEGLLLVRLRAASIALLVVMLFVVAPTTAATIQLESAILGPPLPGGQTINDTQFVGWRFEIDYSLAVSAVGGHLLGNNGNVFAAIVSLDSITQFPPADALVAPDTVGIATPTLPAPSEDVLYPLTAILAPGSYALLFGTGEFGATGTGAIVDSAAQTLIPPTTNDSYILGLRSAPADPLVWQVRPITTRNMRFVVEGVQLAGTADFQLDGDVDVGDLAIWQANFGTTAGATITTGSADNDGDTDGADFLAWQRQFGITSMVAVRSTFSTIPEPASIVLATVCLLVYGLRATRNSQGHKS